MSLTIDESWYQRPAGVKQHLSVGGVVVRVEGDQVLVALVREASGDGWVLPKGHAEPGESEEETARREILEEAGLHELHSLGFLGEACRLNFSKTSWGCFRYYLFITHQQTGIPTDPKHRRRAAEGPGLRWFPLEEAPAWWPEQAALLQQERTEILDRVRRYLQSG